jgi:hypothetical protein
MPGRSWTLVLTVGLSYCPLKDRLPYAHLHESGHIHAIRRYLDVGADLERIRVAEQPPLGLPRFDGQG